LFADGTLNPASCWRRMTLWSVFCYATGLSLLRGSSLFNSEGYGGWKRDSIRAVDVVVGCFLLIDRDLWKQLHGFDQVFFMYGEEADLCHRARQLGARPTITPTATIIHYGAASEPDVPDKRIKLLAGKITLMKRQWFASSAFLGRLLYLTIPITRSVVFGALGSLLGRNDFQRTAQIWRKVWRGRQRWANGWEGHQGD
jgi:N-acetylglucosaminyl-diphospho-decaprenol L-rhamnosyltransferase